jgi:hypothetical protein
VLEEFGMYLFGSEQILDFGLGCFGSKQTPMASFRHGNKNSKTVQQVHNS